MHLRFGLGAWSNRHFDHALYPLGTKHAEWLPRYASVFACAEADILYHQWPEPGTLAEWADAVPEGFRFLPKMHKSVVAGWPVLDRHGEPAKGPSPVQAMRRRGVPEEKTNTSDAAIAVCERFIRDLEPLREKGLLGPVLLQFAKTFAPCQEYLGLLARVLAKAGPEGMAVELRDPGWWTPETRQVLEDARVPLVWSTFDGADVPDWQTGQAGYVRFVGTAQKRRDRWVTSRDRLEDILDMRTRLG